MYLRWRIYPVVAIAALSALILTWSAIGPALAGGFDEPLGPRVYSNAPHFAHGPAPDPCGPAFFRPDGAALDPYPPAGPPADLPDPTLQGLGVGLGFEAGPRRRYAPHNIKPRGPKRRYARRGPRRPGKHRGNVYVGNFWVPLDGGSVELNGVPIERDCP